MNSNERAQIKKAIKSLAIEIALLKLREFRFQTDNIIARLETIRGEMTAEAFKNVVSDLKERVDQYAENAPKGV